MSKAQDKGNALEEAVRAIETAILRASPSYNEKTFIIDGKRIIDADGVRHEIDIWVEVELGAGYRAIFIFECKNWEEKVGKNEIIIFSEKIRAVQAQKGFFVAQTFTADAEAQAAKDSRIVLLRAKQLPPNEVPQIPYGFHAISQELQHIDVSLITSPKGTKPVPIELGTANFLLNGEARDLKKYVEEWGQAEANSCTNRFRSERADEGTHTLTFEAARDFATSQAVLNGKPLLQIKIAGRVAVRVVRARAVSSFEVDGRGRAVSVVMELQDASGTVQGQVNATFINP